MIRFEDEQRAVAGCFSICNNNSIKDPTQIEKEVVPCLDYGCCQTKIPKGLKYLKINLTSFSDHRNIYDSNPCDYAFLTDGTNNAYLVKGPENRVRSQIVLDWAIGNTPCEESKSICGPNTNCINSNYSSGGYGCSCRQGYTGNPFITDEGCQ
ncbi:wall-associated receptor kinase 2-like, partial [Thalictrum thalictroides]